MEFILVILTGTIMGALFTYAFYLGMKYQEDIEKEKEDSRAVKVDERNVEGLKELYKWLNYGGKR